MTWKAPGTVRPGDTITGYTLHDLGGTGVDTASASAHSFTFKGLAAGPHSFVISANSAGGGTSGLSTPSNTITVTAAAVERSRSGLVYV